MKFGIAIAIHLCILIMKLIASFASFKESTSIIIKYFVCDPLYLIALFVLTTYTLSEDEKIENYQNEKYVQLKQQNLSLSFTSSSSHSHSSSSDDKHSKKRSIIG